MTQQEFEEFSAMAKGCKNAIYPSAELISLERSKAIIAVYEYLVELATLEFRQLTRGERLEQFARATTKRGSASRQVASGEDLLKLAAWNGEEQAE